MDDSDRAFVKWWNEHKKDYYTGEDLETAAYDAWKKAYEIGYDDSWYDLCKIGWTT